MTLPFPNSYSHPLPRFSYDSSTGNIHVRFTCDPSYPSPSQNAPSVAWQERQYLVSSIPRRKPPSVLDNAAQFFSSAASRLAPVIAGEEIQRDDEGEFDLRENEIVEEERPAENEVDDSPDIHRDIVVLSLPFLSGRDHDTHGGGSSTARERRRWEILPINKEKATFRSATRSK